MTPTPDRIRELAEEAGFDLVRFGPADPGEHASRFLAWLEAKRHGDMHYLDRNRDRIVDPTLWQPGLRSAVTLAIDYGGPPVALPGGGAIARYAAGRDYHRALGKRIQKLRAHLEKAGIPHNSMRGGTDAVPVLERALAVRSGIGFLAKSSMVISPTLGPYLLLGELLTGVELPTDDPAPGSCGTCTACIEACPTQAITAPHELDARRCLSYTTIELRGFAAPELRQLQGDRFFGCDICLEVCPFASKSPRLTLRGGDRPDDLRPHRVLETYTLVEVLALDEASYQTDWTGTAMRRATRSGLRRNAAVVLGNRGDPQALPHLHTALRDEDAVVRGHAAWAIGRIDPHSDQLELALAREEDARVTDEIERAMAGRHPR